MKVILVSSFLNHHQKPLCEALRSMSDEFVFVATERVEGVGYQRSDDEPYVMNYFEESEKRAIEEKISLADVVIFGACPTRLVEIRMAENKLSFIYSERYFKKGIYRRFIPSVRAAINGRIVRYKDSNLCVLCASAFLPYDLSFFGYPVKKCYKWGYFPRVEEGTDTALLKSKKEKNSILFCARLIPLKHPEQVVLMASRLKRRGYDFDLNILGDGPMRKRLQKMIEKRGLSECVHLLGSVGTDEVRGYMERASVLVFTSNRMEGWGAVVNEAMSAACAVVASHAVGSVPFLISDGVNGLVYESGRVDSLTERVAALLDAPDKSEALGRSAHDMLVSKWNAESAAERLLTLSEHLLRGDESFAFDDGPCSKAEIIKDNWYKRR